MCTSCKKFMNDQLLTLNKEVCHENWKCIYRKKCNLTLTNNLDLHNVLIIIESGSLYHWIQHTKLYMWGKSHALIIFWKLPLILATKQLDYYFLPISPLLCWQKNPKTNKKPKHLMTSSNGNIFRVTGHLCGEFTGSQRPVTRSFDVIFYLRPNKRLSKQWQGWWFETQSRSLWRHRNEKRRTSRTCMSFLHPHTNSSENPEKDFEWDTSLFIFY